MNNNGKTFEVLLERNSNSFGFLRFFFAALVIFSHSYPLGGFGREQITTSVIETYGSLAVSCFFVISGFLITASYSSTNSFFRFLWHRALRIMPGFWLCLFVVALVFGSLEYYMLKNTLTGYAEAATHFVWVNFFLKIKEYQIADLLINHPHPRAWIGTLWSLLYEFYCYLLVGVLGFFAILRFARPAVVMLFFASLALFACQLMYQGGVNRIMPWFVDTWMHKLTIYFLAGMIAYLYRKEIVCEWRLGLGASAIFLYTLIFQPAMYPLVAMVAVPYLVLYLAAVLPLQNFDKHGDFSYGLYLYGFSVQQILVSFEIHKFGFMIYFLSSLVITMPFAILSYYLVEKPCMKLRHLRFMNWR